MTRRFLVKYYYQQKVWCIPPGFFSQYTYYYPQLCSCSKAWLSLIPDILDGLDWTVPTRTDRHNDVHGERTPVWLWHAAECTHETAGQRRSSAGRVGRRRKKLPFPPGDQGGCAQKRRTPQTPPPCRATRPPRSSRRQSHQRQQATLPAPLRAARRASTYVQRRRAHVPCRLRGAAASRAAARQDRRKPAHGCISASARARCGCARVTSGHRQLGPRELTGCALLPRGRLRLAGCRRMLQTPAPDVPNLAAGIGT